MVSEGTTLSDLVAVVPRYARSVHLERDYRARAEGDYILTECALESLRNVAHALRKPADRAMTLVGSYGAGKSAFCVYLARIMESDGGLPGVVEALLTEADVTVLQETRLLTVPVVGSRQPLGAALIRALLEALSTHQLASVRAAIGLRAEKLMQEDSRSARGTADLFKHTAELLQDQGWEGILLMVDEMGKFLEYAALHPTDGDVFVLQELAEAAARSGDAPLVMLGILHQSAEAYAQKLSRTHQAEWAKVAERFRPLNFFPSELEQVDLIGRALGHRTELPLEATVGGVCQAYLELDLLSGGLRSRFAELARAAYPLHPLSLLALPVLFRRTGQSHRSMFNFLAAEEPHALGSFLKETSFAAEAPPFYTLDRLFDYATEILAGGWHATTDTRAWADAIEAMERAADLGPNAQRVLKVIALLGILRHPRLPASTEIIQLVFAGSALSSEEVQHALRLLKERKFVVLPRARGTYRLCQAGDVDVEAALTQARSRLPESTTLDAATRLCPPPRLIARRHSYQTGAVRTVAVRPCLVEQLPSFLHQAAHELTIILCLARDETAASEAEEHVRRIAAPHVLTAVAVETDALREAALDVAAAAEAAKADGMDTDRAARIELAVRHDEAIRAFQAEWGRLFGPEPGGARWWRAADAVEMSGSRNFSELLSTLADDFYRRTPHLRNELINRHQLSSAGAAARRSLIEGMLSRADRPRLGIAGFPPELSMYECVLRATGLHRETAPGVWGFVPPDPAGPSRLYSAWQAIETFLFDGPPRERPVKELFELLSGREYGVTGGVLPVLLCAFLQAHKSETTLYREGSFLPDPTVPDWEVLLRRPELFALAGCRIRGSRRAVIERLARGFGTDPEVLPVVRYLLKMVKNLPEHAWKTQQLPSEVLALREACRKVRSPERLLFAEIPEALGVPLGDAEVVHPDAVEQFFRALNGALLAWSQATGRVVDRARDHLLAACGFSEGPDGWLRLQEQCKTLNGTILPPNLLPFVQRAAEPRDLQASVDTVLALVANRPPRNWSDPDEIHFRSKANAIGGLLQSTCQPICSDDEQLTPTELLESQRVANTIRNALPKSVDPRLLRAALNELLAQLQQPS